MFSLLRVFSKKVSVKGSLPDRLSHVTLRWRFEPWNFCLGARPSTSLPHPTSLYIQHCGKLVKLKKNKLLWYLNPHALYSELSRLTTRPSDSRSYEEIKVTKSYNRPSSQTTKQNLVVRTFRGSNTQPLIKKPTLYRWAIWTTGR